MQRFLYKIIISIENSLKIILIEKD